MRFTYGFAEAASTSTTVDQDSSFVHTVDLDEPRFREVVDGLGLSDDEARSYVDAVRSVHVFARK